jgi:biopolymer transport protein ExbD
MMNATLAGVSEEGALLPTRGHKEHAHVDIVAMIDLVFMMNIFFMVTTLTAGLMALKLPQTRTGMERDADRAVVFSLVATGDGQTSEIYIGSPTDEGAEPLPNTQEQEDMIVRAVEVGVAQNKPTVMICAERDVRYRDVARVAALVGEVEGAEMFVGVIIKPE